MLNLQYQWDRFLFLGIRQELYDDLARTLIDVDPKSALKEMARAAPTAQVARIYAGIHNGIQRGFSMSKALEPYAPIEDIQMLRAFEYRKASAEQLCGGLKVLADNVEGTKQVREAFRNLGFQLVFSFVLLLLVVVQVRTQAYPVLLNIFPLQEWNAYSSVIYSLAGLITVYWWAIAGLGITLSVLFIYSLDKWTGPLRERLDAYAPYSWYRQQVAMETLTTLAAQLQADLPVLHALQEMEKSATKWQASYLRRMVRNVTRRKGASTFDVGLFDAQVMARIYLLSLSKKSENPLLEIGLKGKAHTVSKLVKRVEITRTVVSKGALIIGAAFVAGFMFLIPQMMTSFTSGRGF